MNYHERLQKFFKERGVSQKQVAEELEITASLVSRYFNKNAPNYEFIQGITKHHPSIDWNYIFKGSVNVAQEDEPLYLKRPENLLDEIKDRVFELEKWHKYDTENK